MYQQIQLKWCAQVLVTCFYPANLLSYLSWLHVTQVAVQHARTSPMENELRQLHALVSALLM